KRKRNDSLSGVANGTNCHSDTFYFPRTTTIHLKHSHVSSSDIAILPLYSSHQWLVDFTVCAACVYLINEVAYNCFIPWFESSDRNRTTLPGSMTIRNSPYLISLSSKNNTTTYDSRPLKCTANTTPTKTPSGECILILAAGFLFLYRYN
ncbi:Transmembrane protein, partial [Schistosoma japonicum]